MEFLSLGKVCFITDCRQLDFLPFTCSFCGVVTCLTHMSPQKHNCRYIPENKTIECPICNRIISVSIIDQHIDLGCPKLDPIKPFKCSWKFCKNSHIEEIICKNCKKIFCLKHRFPTDHKCIKV